MRKAAIVLLAVITGLFLWQVSIGPAETAVAKTSEKEVGAASLVDEAGQQQMVMEAMNLQPLAFTENQGQWDDRVLYRANAGGATMWFTSDGVYYQFTRRVPKEDGARSIVGHDLLGRDYSAHDRFDHERDNIESIMIKASFVGANPNPQVSGVEEMEYKCNYFIGNDPAQWHTNVPNYRTVVFKDIYAGIDLCYYGNGGGKMEYDFIVAPGVDVSRIQVRYEGTRSLSVNDSGELVVETDWNEVKEQRPLIYQVVGDDRREIAGSYTLLSANSFGFTLGADYDQTLPVVIDPTLVYSTYLGGSASDGSSSIAVDGSGCAYVTGTTGSTDFPTQGEYQTFQGNYDAFVTKLNSSGTGLVYSTYLGGSNFDAGNGIAVDASGSAYVTGFTNSTDFPTQEEYQTYQGYTDVFVTKLTSTGAGLVYSTYLGGSSHDDGYGIAVDGSGSAYVTGHTLSTDFPTQGEYQTDQGDYDVFVTKLNSSGAGLVYSTYLGGSDYDWGLGIAVDGSGSAYVTGFTHSTDFPIQGEYQTDQGEADVFVTKLNSSGTGLIYSTYLGGSNADGSEGIAVDGLGSVYVMGSTSSLDFPTKGEYQTYQGNYDVFVIKLNSSGAGLVYSTYLGGSDDDLGYGTAVDGSGDTYVTGYTYSPDFPTQGEYQADQGEADVFVTKLNSSGAGLVYSTYLGGSDDDVSLGIAVDGSGSAYVTGYTYSPDFPTQGEYQTFQGLDDAFVTKLVPYVCGDADGNGIVNISDAVHLIAYIFGGGPEPVPYEAGDVDCNEIVNISDVVYLIAYIFAGGPEPCAECP